MAKQSIKKHKGIFLLLSLILCLVAALTISNKINVGEKKEIALIKNKMATQIIEGLPFFDRSFDEFVAVQDDDFFQGRLGSAANIVSQELYEYINFFHNPPPRDSSTIALSTQIFDVYDSMNTHLFLEPTANPGGLRKVFNMAQPYFDLLFRWEAIGDGAASSALLDERLERIEDLNSQGEHNQQVASLSEIRQEFSKLVNGATPSK